MKMKDYLLIFCALAITGLVKSSSLEYENGQTLPANLYNNLPNIGREGFARNLNLLNSDNYYLSPNELARNGNSNNLNQLNSENNNLLRNANNYYHLNPENNNLQRNNLLRERNYLNLDHLENYNLGRQGAPSSVNPAETLSADQDLDVAALEPKVETRAFDFSGGGAGGGAGGEIGGGISGGISGSIGISAGLSGYLGAGAGAHGYGYGGGGFAGNPYYG